AVADADGARSRRCSIHSGRFAGAIPHRLDPRQVNASHSGFQQHRCAVGAEACVMFDGLKYIESESTGRQELFDLTKDPGETMSIALVAPDKIAKARALLAERLAAANAMRARRHITTTLRKMDR